MFCKWYYFDERNMNWILVLYIENFNMSLSQDTVWEIRLKSAMFSNAWKSSSIKVILWWKMKSLWVSKWKNLEKLLQETLSLIRTKHRAYKRCYFKPCMLPNKRQLVLIFIIFSYYSIRLFIRAVLPVLKAPNRKILWDLAKPHWV